MGPKDERSSSSSSPPSRSPLVKSSSLLAFSLLFEDKPLSIISHGPSLLSLSTELKSITLSSSSHRNKSAPLPPFSSSVSIPPTNLSSPLPPSRVSSPSSPYKMSSPLQKKVK
ncbi:MAG: hypothetical protein MUO21_04255 [Nitrososphaeraceae archaeon]|nr:hypothetical protein [Nitrososphaeraceae archaeon]